MKIMTFNVRAGGNNTYGSTPTNSKHLDDILTTVHNADADLVVLTDTFRWTEMFTEVQLRDLFGYRQVVCINTNDKPMYGREKPDSHPLIGITVLARDGIIIGSEVSYYHNRQFIRLEVDVNGVATEVFAVYLDALSEQVRLEQAVAIATVSRLYTMPSIIIGDLNSPPHGELPLVFRALGILARLPGLRNISARRFVSHEGNLFPSRHAQFDYAVVRLRDLAKPMVLNYLLHKDFHRIRQVVPTRQVWGRKIALDHVLVARHARIDALFTMQPSGTFTDHLVLIAEVTSY